MTRKRKLTATRLCNPLKDDLILCSGKKAGLLSAVPPASPSPSIQSVRGESGVASSSSVDSQNYTESALKELYQQVTNMPESAKKKKLIRQVTEFCCEANKRLTAHLTLAPFCLCAVRKAALVDANVWLSDAFQQETLALALFRWNDKGKTLFFKYITPKRLKFPFFCQRALSICFVIVQMHCLNYCLKVKFCLSVYFFDCFCWMSLCKSKWIILLFFISRRAKESVAIWRKLYLRQYSTRGFYNKIFLK